MSFWSYSVCFAVKDLFSPRTEIGSSEDQLNCLETWLESEANVNIAGVSATVCACV